MCDCCEQLGKQHKVACQLTNSEAYAQLPGLTEAVNGAADGEETGISLAVFLEGLSDVLFPESGAGVYVVYI
jgi:hypothetical protein